MRVITGSAKGRRLHTLEGIDVRPTTEIVKEAMFSIIQFEIEGRRVLDLFAGSGQLGIEALSRGAKNAVFVDASRQSLKVVNDNLEVTGFSKISNVLCTDSIAFLRGRTGTFDIAFLDPPYKTGLLQKALENIDRAMSEAGIIVCEAPYGEAMPETAGDFPLFKSYKHGKTCIHVYRKTFGGDE